MIRPLGFGVEVTRSQLWRARPSIAGWSFALAAVSAMYAGFWPAFEGETLQALTDDLPPALVEALGYEGIGTAEGWLTSTIYGLLGPLLLLAFGIGFGARSMAGDERDGVLAVELSQPITRAEAALGRLLAGIVQLAILVLAVTIATGITALIVGMGVSIGQLIEGADSLFTFAVPWLATSWAIAAITGRREVAVGATTALAVLAYALHVLGPATGNEALGNVSPFHWYLDSELLSAGAHPGVLAFAIVTTALAAVVGATVFTRRDIDS